MHVFHTLEDFPSRDQPLVLTIGNFDGVHRGHQALFSHMKTLAGENGQTAILTFFNHPSSILRPQNPTPLLCSLDHRLKLIEDWGMDYCVVLPFNEALASQCAASFIQHLKTYIPFSHLVVGFDAKIGKDRKGDAAILSLLSEHHAFALSYLPEEKFESQAVSSSLIRSALKHGNLNEVEKLLGRPYSLFGPIVKGHGRGKGLGFPTANLELTALCLPPFGVYAVKMIKKGRKMQGIANLGIAPTLQKHRNPLLEVHLFTETDEDFYGEKVEVIFEKFIRPEIQFSSADALRNQIAADIASVRAHSKT